MSLNNYLETLTKDNLLLLAKHWLPSLKSEYKRRKSSIIDFLLPTFEYQKITVPNLEMFLEQ